LNRQGNILLYPFSLLYGAVTGFRNFLYNSGILSGHEFNIPIISVGNITVGGTGKTPHCEYIIELLSDKLHVAILSRGYKRKTKGFLIARPEMNPSDTGDEPLQICRKFPGVTVAVDRNRVNGVRSLLKVHPETEVIILDDAYQHRRIKPGYSIMLTDFSRLMIHDHMLPYGELRENVKNMFRSDIILITKSPSDLSAIRRRLIVKEIGKAPWQNLYFTSLAYKDPVPVFPGTRSSCSIFKDGKKDIRGIVLVTGIAKAELLREYMGNYASEIIHFSFPDHHNFSSKDITGITKAFDGLRQDEKYIITTEKDAVRLREFSDIAEPVRSSFFSVPVGITFLNDDGNEFDNMIIEYVRRNKRNNRVSQE
jgi:tetraacyldisaccharide 4'-kinase